jgi:hypothetical protein
MRVRLSGLFLLALVALPLKAQDDKMAAGVKAQIKKMLDATVAGKYDAVLEMTHPKVLEEVGGKEKALEAIKEAMDAAKAKGFTFKVPEIGQPTVAKSKGDYFTVAPYTLVVSGMGKKVVMKTAVIGVSKDDGKTWKFVNLDAEGEAKVRRFLPDLPRELKVPKHEQKIEDNP